MAENETDILEAALDVTAAVISGVQPAQDHLPTPCPGFDVAHLVDHLVGWARSFADRLAGASGDQDPNGYHAGADPADEYRRAAAQIVQEFRRGGVAGAPVPIGVLVMETVVHGWDLATATGQPAPFSRAAADLGLAEGRAMLKPEFRGPGKSFGYEVTVDDDASSMDRLVAFLGREPTWTPSASD